MFGMIMAYDRKKPLSFYFEVVHEDLTVPSVLLANWLPK